MKSFKSACACAILAFTSNASANPPAGIFTPVHPSAMRYHLTLVDQWPGEGSPCINEQSKQLSLVDASGKYVQGPFVVPSGQKFVMTDVSFHAHPGKYFTTFDGSPAVMLDIQANFPGQAPIDHLTVPASQVGTGAAAGAHSFTTGPAFVLGTSFCAKGIALGEAGGTSIPINGVRVHGYLMNDDPNEP